MTWLTGWNYRKSIAISNTGSLLTNYPVSIIIDTAGLITAIPSKMRSDCGDIRFTDIDGSTLLPYWIESGVNTVSTKIWIKIPSILVGTVTIYLYYNNPTATYNNSVGGTGTFDLFDDFNDGDVSDWVKTTYNLTVSSSFSADSSFYVSPPYSLKIYNYANCYTSPYSGGETRMSKTVSLSNGRYIADFYQKMTGMRDRACQFGNTSIGTIFYINDVSYFSRFLDPGTCAVLTTGDVQQSTSSPFDIVTGSAKISLSVYSGDCDYITGWFDDVRIRKYTSPEPTFSSIGTEQIPPGSLRITSTPSGAGIYLAPHGQTPLWQNIYTPDPIPDLIAGNYDIRLTKSGYEDWTFNNAEIISNTETQISANLVLLATPANITATNMVITPSATPCIAGTCTVTVDVTWTNTGGTSGTFTPSIKIDTIPLVVTPPLTSVSIGPSGTKLQQFIITGMTTGTHTICPDPN